VLEHHRIKRVHVPIKMLVKTKARPCSVRLSAPDMV